MRLFEITNTLTPDKFDAKNVPTPRDAEFGMRDQEEIGSGVFASAFSTKQEPGTVRKISNIMDERNFREDAYFKYVQLLAKNDRFTGNPYFPRVFDVQVKKFPLDPDDPTTFYDYAYAVDMERLQDWDTLSNQEALMLGEKMFHNFKSIASHHIKSNIHPDNEGGKKKYYKYALMDFMSEIFSTFNPGTKTTVFKDSNLKKAIMLIRSLHNKTRDSGQPMFMDIHSGNIMVRRGPGGPQLVFTDPVAN